MKRPKVIVLTGGGSGGHLVPLISVAEALKAESPEYKLIYIGQKGDKLGDIMINNPLFSAVYTVRAGKFRRYHGEGLKQLLDVKTVALNMRDLLYVLVGFFQSVRLMGKLKPQVVFSRGGFVSVPVCLAAALRRTPYITHDSDAIPSLANRIIARWATHHAVALPKEIYPYSQEKTVTTGVPIQKSYRYVTDKIKLAAREKLDIPKTAKLLLVTGGGNGAQRLNEAVTAASKRLFTDVSGLYIIHVAGRGEEDATNAAYKKVLSSKDLSRIRVFGFTTDMALFSEAATLVITRAGATAIAEFATQAKACIIIPNNQLTGGHQTKNALAYHRQGAAIVLPESELGQLAKVTTELMKSKNLRQQLSEKIAQFATKDSAGLLAHLVLATALKSSL